MVEQGFSISISPTYGKPNTYDLWLYSQAWENGACVTSRQMNLGEFQALPSEVSARSFPEWIDTMASVAFANLKRQLLVHDVPSISAATQAASGASGTQSQTM